MDWTRVNEMDPHLLVGVVNTRLRNEDLSLDELCRQEDLDGGALRARLATAGYTYRPAVKQFR
ncbi:MAG: DUF4250 domain-containing protein [Opitutales bacterium]